MTETVSHPAHYNSLGAKCSSCGFPIECFDVVERMHYNLGTAVAYVWRAPWKGGTEDLRKAVEHLQREIERLGREAGDGGQDD